MIIHKLQQDSCVLVMRTGTIGPHHFISLSVGLNLAEGHKVGKTEKARHVGLVFSQTFPSDCGEIVIWGQSFLCYTS